MVDKPNMGAMFGGKSSGGFLGVAEGPLDKSVDIAILGVPAATPYASVGPYCATAAQQVRSAQVWPGISKHHDFDLGEKVIPDNVTVVDLGDLDYSEVDFVSNRQNITNAVEEILSIKAVPVVIGGDDSVPIPVFQAFKDYGPVTVIQFDAHIDWRDNVDGERYGLSSNMRRASEMPWVKHMVQIGARGIGSAKPLDFQDAIDWGVRFFPMREYRKSSFEKVLAAIPNSLPVIINFDIDVMDPTVVPGVIGPAPGGFDYYGAVEIIEKIASNHEIAGFNLLEFMPDNDIQNRSALVASRIITTVLNLVSKQKGKR